MSTQVQTPTLVLSLQLLRESALLRGSSGKPVEVRVTLAAVQEPLRQVSAITEVASQVASEEHEEYSHSIGSQSGWLGQSQTTVSRLHLESPLEIVLTITGALSASSVGALALVRLIEHVFNTPVRVRADREEHETRAAAARLDRANLEERYREILERNPQDDPRRKQPVSDSRWRAIIAELWKKD